MSLNIKLVFNEEIHRLSNLPATYKELQRYCESVYNAQGFLIKYLDEENDEITIACDNDLITAYTSAESLGIKSLRFHLSLSNQNLKNCAYDKVPDADYVPQKCPETQTGAPMDEDSPIHEDAPTIWEKHTCDGCGTKPIVGPRFNCTVCRDFDYCTDCEVKFKHPHPFIKFVKKTNDQYINIDLSSGNILEQFNQVKNFLFNQKPKCLVSKQFKFGEMDSGDLVFTWIAKNNGNCAWPSGCSIEMVKGNVSAVFNPLPQIAPGQEAEIVAKTWSDGGKVFGKWKIITPDGKKMGVIKAKGFVRNNLNGKIDRMVEMGFDANASKQALKKANGDLEQAILSLS
jgi:PB1 domain/Zinc finger, ZZ type/Ig-like domain from next to BRCA1 gene/UBA/TS-N domain